MKTLLNASSWATIALALAAPSVVLAQITAAASAGRDASATSVDELIVTGTRLTGLRASDSPAPVEVLDAGALQRVAQSDLVQAIAQNIPSFNAQAFGGDTSNLTLSAKLRGLSPNHALVLIDGKRRHGTANLSVGSSPFQGGATADLSFIPLGSVDHIEVLQDGAAAQYGSDAIAGVINIILKKNDRGGAVSLTGGQYFDEGGKTGDLSATIGIQPVEKAYLDLTFESRWHGHSFRGDADPRVQNTPFNTTSASRLSQFPTLAGAPGYPYLNLLPGDAEYRLNIGAFNAGYDLGGGAELYSFGTYGHKYGGSYENYRLPNGTIGKDGTLARPLGYTPVESIQENDYAVTAGVRGGAPESFTWDLATTYGKDSIGVNVLNSLNRSLYIDTSTATTRGQSPTDFHNGDFISSQWTTTLDLSKALEVGLATPLTVSVGAEYREETFTIKPGDAASRYKEGSQSYPGFALTDAGDHSRQNYGLYADLAVSPVTALKLDGAVRFEHFSDAGDTTVFKGTGRYDFGPAFALRGTLSTGFRAPTLAEEFYSATNVSPTSAFVQLPPNSPAARLIGVDGLKPEKSTNFSVGFVANPAPGLTVTLDAYQITVRDRIVGSGQLFGSGGGTNIAAVRNAILANGNILDPTVTQTGIQLFTNGLNTRTRGAELVAGYASDFGDLGAVQWSFTGNYNSTKVTKIKAPPTQLAGASLFDPTALSYLQDASPKYRLATGALWTWRKLAINLKETLFGPLSSVNSRNGAIYYKTEIRATPITDLEAAYKVTQSVRAAIGANNLFNKYPDKISPLLRADYLQNNSQAYVSLYPSISPFGINGGYYYGRVTVSF